MAAHTEVSDVVEEDHAGGAVAIDGLAEECSDDDVGTAGFGYYGGTEVVVVAAKTLEAFGERAFAEVGGSGNHEARRLAAGVRIDDTNFSVNVFHFGLSYPNSDNAENSRDLQQAVPRVDCPRNPKLICNDHFLPSSSSPLVCLR